MSNYIITIARQYGSQGRRIARTLANKLGFEFLDNEIISHIAESYDVDTDILEKYDEKSPGKFAGMFSPSITISNTYIPMYNNILFNDEVMRLQAKVLRERLDANSIVVVGRCADYIFKNEENLLRVFIYADEAVRLKTIVEDYKVPQDEAKSVLKKADKNRASYYSTYADGKWGDAKNYDLCINTSKISKEDAVDLILQYKVALDKTK